MLISFTSSLDPFMSNDRTAPSTKNIARALVDEVAWLRAAGIYGRTIRAISVEESRAEGEPVALNRAGQEKNLGITDRIRESIDSIFAPDKPTPSENLSRLRDHQLVNPPKEYVVRYYAWDNKAKPRPELVEESFSQGKDPSIRPGNAMQPINQMMRDDFHGALASITAQLPGRFRFVAVNDPAQADIQIAAVPRYNSAAGAAIRSNGSILLDTSEFSSTTNIRNNPEAAEWHRNHRRRAVLHEVAHALGLAHPHEPDGEGKAVHAGATYFDTQMTYDPNNKSGRGMTESQVPVSLMPDDLRALIGLYPVTADRRGLAIGLAPGVALSNTIGATITSASGAYEVKLPNSGVVFQHHADSRNDTVQLRASNPANFVQLKQDRHGVTIGEPKLANATHLRFSPEHIRTSAAGDMVTLQNNASIYVERNDKGARDGIVLYGSGNRISVPVGGEKSTLFSLHGDDYHFTLRNRGARIEQLPQINVYAGVDPSKVTRTWSRDEAAHYQITFTSGKQTRTIHFELEDASPRAIKRMDALMDNNFTRATQRLSPPSTTAIEAARDRVHGTKAADFSAVEKQLLLEAAGYQTDGITGKADGKVDGQYGMTSKRAEASLRTDLAAGRLNNLPKDVLDDIRAAFPADKAPSMRATNDANVQRPASGNPQPSDRSTKR